MADSMHFNLLSPRGDPPLRAEMSNLSRHSNLYAKLCVQATEHEAPHVPTKGTLMSRWSDGVQDNRTILTFEALAGSLLAAGHLHYFAISSSA